MPEVLKGEGDLGERSLCTCGILVVVCGMACYGGSFKQFR